VKWDTPLPGAEGTVREPVVIAEWLATTTDRDRLLYVEGMTRFASAADRCFIENHDRDVHEHRTVCLAAPWRRDFLPVLVCTCGHLMQEHRNDLKRASCGRGGCSCTGYVLGARRWTERRVVEEPVGPPPRATHTIPAEAVPTCTTCGGTFWLNTACVTCGHRMSLRAEAEVAARAVPSRSTTSREDTP
jgi:Zn ribbon nucleic-acid-binding protein